MQVTPSKKLGQNFLSAPQAAEDIVAFADIPADASVLEVGPGLGVLTEILAKRCQRLVAVELEKAFAEYLTSKFCTFHNVQIIHSNILRFDPGEYFNDRIHLISNLPYSISSRVLEWCFRYCKYFNSVTLLLQREFAERLAAEPGSRKYGSLSVLRKRYANAELGPVIGPENFFPAPDVDSQLIRLDFFDEEKEIGDVIIFEKCVKAAFSHKRKTILNNFQLSGMFKGKEQVKNLLTAINLEPTLRAEMLDLEDFKRLADAYIKLIKADRKDIQLPAL